MSRNLMITISCDSNDCFNTLSIDLSEGNWEDCADIKIERSLDENSWYSNLDGDYCRNCADGARKNWRIGSHE